MLTPIGRARIRAIHHLAQGNPRVYIILSEFLTRESLDELVDPVLRMLDDLTPYYQSRLSSLSPQQRKLVEFLASYRIPCKVKELARRCFVSQQTASGQLRKLAEWGYVRSESQGRESYYELREPFMRFCLDLKKERKEPLRPLVEFVRIWWTPDDLELQIHRLEKQITPTVAYIAKALEICKAESRDPRVKACRKDFVKYIESDQHTKALEVAEEWVAVSKDIESYFNLAQANFFLERWEAVGKALAPALELAPNNFYVAVFAALAAGHMREFAKSVDIASRALDIADQDVPADLRLGILRVKVTSLLMLERFQEMENASLSIPKSLFNSNDYYFLAVAQTQMHRLEEALANIQISIARGGGVRSRILKALILAEADRWEEVLPEIKESIGISAVEVRERIEMLGTIALLAMRPGRKGPSFLTGLNQLLEASGLPLVQLSHVMAFAAKELIQSDGSERAQRLAGFFTELSAIPADDQSLRVLETAFEYAKSHDESVLFRLPLEERQLIQTLIGVDSSKNPTTTIGRSDDAPTEDGASPVTK
jgi:tetratricopeptide (TPR) repeat protein